MCGVHVDTDTPPRPISLIGRKAQLGLESQKLLLPMTKHSVEALQLLSSIFNARYNTVQALIINYVDPLLSSARLRPDDPLRILGRSFHVPHRLLNVPTEPLAVLQTFRGFSCKSSVNRYTQCYEKSWPWVYMYVSITVTNYTLIFILYSYL